MSVYSAAELSSQAHDLHLATGVPIATEPLDYITEPAGDLIGAARADFDSLANLLETNRVNAYDTMEHLGILITSEDELVSETKSHLYGCYIPTPRVIEADDGECIHYPIIVLTASQERSTQELINQTALHEVGHLVHGHDHALYKSSIVNRVRAMGGLASTAATSMLGLTSESLMLSSVITGIAVAGGALAASPTLTRKTIRTLSPQEHVADYFAYKHQDVQLITLES
ncbi:MAG TPA: hypothetical protein VHT70_01285 [Candidatus Saccharimonadales bacterium]|jgi:hypothetical protein|nr:hypothetical protein [Candidatus Saccharimonadales bacterium]